MQRAQKIDNSLYKSIFSNRIQRAIQHTVPNEYYECRLLYYIL